MRASPPNFIVGIGGSAGGLYAFTTFLDALPDTTGMAFVIISHMLPDSSHTLLSHLLTSHTKMPVQVASAAMPILANHVYVNPPNVDLRVEDYRFKVSSPRTMNRQVDIFLSSLAAAIGARAIGVILSGYDGDGTEGCVKIKSKSGITFAQDSAASVGNMPLSAQDSGCIDFVLPTDKIGAALQKLTHPKKKRAA